MHNFVMWLSTTDDFASMSCFQMYWLCWQGLSIVLVFSTLCLIRFAFCFLFAHRNRLLLLQNTCVSLELAIPPLFLFHSQDLELYFFFMLNQYFSMKIFLLINVKMPTVVGILTFVSGKNSILGISEPKNGRISR